MNATTRPRPTIAPGAVARPRPRGVVAALDERAAAHPVLEVARTLAACTERPVTAVHVEEDVASREAVERLAARAGVELVVLQGDPLDVLAAVAAAPDVDVLVVGARGLPATREAVGHIAGALVRAGARAPLLLVPPQHHPGGRPRPRVLAPLDTDQRCAEASEAVVGVLRRAGCEVVGVHVFETASVPAFLDHPGHGARTWRGEFARRHGLPDVELRSGAPASRILQTAREHDVDLVVLSWSGVLDDRHGRVVGHVLAGSEVPVLLVPVAHPVRGEDRS